jgi:hypothetical protein
MAPDCEAQPPPAPHLSDHDDSDPDLDLPTLDQVVDLMEKLKADGCGRRDLWTEWKREKKISGMLLATFGAALTDGRRGICQGDRHALSSAAATVVTTEGSLSKVPGKSTGLQTV